MEDEQEIREPSVKWGRTEKASRGDWDPLREALGILGEPPSVSAFTQPQNQPQSRPALLRAFGSTDQRKKPTQNLKLNLLEDLRRAADPQEDSP